MANTSQLELGLGRFMITCMISGFHASQCARRTILFLFDVGAWSRDRYTRIALNVSPAQAREPELAINITTVS